VADTSNLQAIVARSPDKSFFSVLMFSIADPVAARGFLRTWTPQTPAGAAPDTAGVGELHFLFSWSGLEKLLAGNPDLDPAVGRKAFDTFFVDPAQAPDSAAMAGQLGFIGKSDPGQWWQDFKSSDVEMAIYGAFDDAAQRADYVERLRTSAAGLGLVELRLPSFPDGAAAGYRPPGGRLHFGYRDGLTTPDIDWTDSGRPGAVDPREVITGYPSDDYPTTPFKPGPWQDFSREGAYAALTWICQDVGRFEAYLETNKAKVAPLAGTADPKEWLASRLLGRWRDGTSVALCPTPPANPPDLDNAFGYADDPSGLKCPLTAHIRIANSRDQPLKFANRIRFPKGPPRLLRRGFSYGGPWQSPADDGEERGIVGIFLFARVNEQFYTVLRWMHRTDFSDVFQPIPNTGQDALIGDRSDPASSNVVHLPSKGAATTDIGLDTFINYRGVVVLFAPGIHALAILAGTAPP
jgi:deferrochelatase/peroxidase EfeB